MTITTSSARNDYIGTGALDTYSYTFLIFLATDLVVTRTDTGGVEVTLLLNTDFTVTGVEDPNGGTIVLTAGNLATNFELTIRRVRPLAQNTDIRNQGDFFPEVHEDSFDNATMVDQQQQDAIDRSVKLPVSVIPVTDFDPTFPTDIDGAISKSPVTNLTGDGWALASTWPTSSDIAAAEGFADDAAASAAAAATSVGTNMPFGLNNVGFAAAVASSALTIDLKQSDGSSDPTSTASEEAFLYFRSSTATTGGYIQRTVTAALTIVIPSGATMGHDNSLEDYIYIYALDNSGTVELAVSSSWHWDEGQLVTTSTLDATSDDASAIYSTTSRSNVPIRLIGRLLSNQTTAGTYGTAPSRLETRSLFKLDTHIFTRAADISAKHGIIYLLSTASARNIQLPPPELNFRFWVKDSTNQASTNNITLVRDGSEDIEGTAASFVYATSFGSFQVISDGTDWFVTDYVFEIPTEVEELSNLGLATTVAASALTIALKQLDGSTDANAAAPVKIAMRSSTLTSGAVIARQVTAALSLVVPNGATLGTTSAVEASLYVYAIDNSGTIELAVSNTEFNTEGVVTTTLIDATADSATVIYSATARTNVPFRLIGKLLATEATAGVWATAPSTVTVGGDFDVQTSYTEFINTSTQVTEITTSFSSLTDGTTVVNHSLGTPVTTASDAYTLPFAGLWKLHISAGRINASTADEVFMARVRNTTTSATAATSSTHRAPDVGSAEIISIGTAMQMTFEVVTITDVFEVQWVCGANTMSVTSSTVDGEDGQAFLYVFEYLGK